VSPNGIIKEDIITTVQNTMRLSSLISKKKKNKFSTYRKKNNNRNMQTQKKNTKKNKTSKKTHSMTFLVFCL